MRTIAGRPLDVRDDAPQGFRWTLTGPPLPVTMALPFAEAARSMVYRAADDHGLFPLPDAFHHGSDETHSHAFWLPEDADADGNIDHLLLFVRAGLPDRLIPLLAAGGMVFLGRRGEWRLAPDWLGRGGHRLSGPAALWTAVTPYVTPFRGPRTDTGMVQDPERQLRGELGLRRTPKPVSILFAPSIVRGSGVFAANQFVLSTKSRNAPAGAAASAVTILFPAPVCGPLALGYGAHFGLGLFEPHSGGEDRNGASGRTAGAPAND